MVSTTANCFLCDSVVTDFRYSDKARLEFGEAAGASPPSVWTGDIIDKCSETWWTLLNQESS
jgi:hypothetical protein